MKLSIVTTLYKSESHINEFHDRILTAIKEIDIPSDQFELIFVDDGSPDDSLKTMIELSKQNAQIKVVELSKNHGHHRAMMIGLEMAEGDKVFLIDSDLEEAPELLTEFWNQMKNDKHIDVVYGVQSNKLSFSFSSYFYKIFNFFSYVKIPENELVSRLMNRKYVEAITQYHEQELFIPGVWSDVGFNKQAVISKKSSSSDSTYSFSKKITLAIDAITSFSTKPLLFIFYIGALISIFSLLYSVFLILNKILFGAPLAGWTSILVSIYLVGGIIIFSIGTIGIYISRVFLETKKRPRSLIRNIYQGGKVHEKK